MKYFFQKAFRQALFPVDPDTFPEKLCKITNFFPVCQSIDKIFRLK